MKTAKLGAIFLVSVMALAGTGAAYAMWFDTLYVDGYVETGYIGAEWSIEAWGDSEPEGKDFSSIYAYIWTGYNNNDWLSISIYNAYPCITYWVYFDITNTGSIPIHVEDIDWDYNGILDDQVGTFGVTIIKNGISYFYNLPSGGKPVKLANGFLLYGNDAGPSFEPLMRLTATNIDAAGNIWAVNNWKPSAVVDLQGNPGGDGVVVFLGQANV